MRLPDRPSAESELAAGSDRLGRDQPGTSRCLADRLASMSEAHPAAWSATDRADARNGRLASADAWWRGESDAWWQGESDAWWRGPDPVSAETDDDVIDGTDDPGEIGAASEDDSDRATDAGGAGEPDGPPGGSNGRAARPQTPRPAANRTGQHRGRGDGRWSEVGGPRSAPAGPDHGAHRPWFSAGGAGDPWFAAGSDQHRAGS